MFRQTLKELGVERLVLPAVPGVLNTWTTSFGFKQMTDSERVQFVSYTFLDFQGTIMCCKELQDVPSTEPSLPGGILQLDWMYSCKETVNQHITSSILSLEGTLMNLTEDNNSNGDSDSNKDSDNADQVFSNTSEVVQGDATEGTDIVDQDHTGYSKLDYFGFCHCI